MVRDKAIASSAFIAKCIKLRIKRSFCLSVIMMRKIILMLCLSTVRPQENACDTFCNCEGAIVSCANAPFFPTFITTTNIQTLIFIDSQIHSLDSVTQEQFPNLRSLVLRNCPLITCYDIQSLQLNWEQLRVNINIQCTFTTSYSTYVSIHATVTENIRSSSTSEVHIGELSRFVTESIRSTRTRELQTPDNSATTTTTLHNDNETDSSKESLPLHVIAALTTGIAVLIVIIVVIVAVCIYAKYKRNRVRNVRLILDDMPMTSVVNHSTTI